MLLLNLLAALPAVASTLFLKNGFALLREVPYSTKWACGAIFLSTATITEAPQGLRSNAFLTIDLFKFPVGPRGALLSISFLIISAELIDASSNCLGDIDLVRCSIFLFNFSNPVISKFAI